MKYSLCIVLVWVSVITHTTAVLANETRDENASNLVLSLDCEGQLFFPFLEAHFNFSERVLSIFWDLKHHMIDFSPCNYTDSACNTTRVYKRGDETIYTVQMHFESCPKKIRPAILITCVGEKCSKLYRPCESDSDCLPTLTCGTSLGADLDSYGDQLISEILSQILYPQHRPTTRWSLCDVSYYTTVVQLNEQVSGGITNVAENREQQLRHSAFIVNSPGNASLLQATCNGRIDLFGRRHFVGVIPRAIQTLSMLPTGILKQALDTNTIVKLMKWFGVAYIPLGRYYIYLAEKYTESDISLVDKDVGKWLVRHRLFGETITIEINPCATKDDNVFLDVKATEGIQSLLSYKSCSRHTECASAVCLPSRRIAWSQQKTTPLLLKRLLEIEGLNNICFPKLQNTVTTPFDNDTFSSELVSIFDTHIFPQPYTQKKNQPAQQVANQCTQADQSSGSSFWTWILAIFFFVLLIGGCSKKDPEQQQ